MERLLKKRIIKNTLFLILGYVVGRLFHIFNYYFTNNLPIPHHWITGCVLVGVSWFTQSEWLLYFSSGLIISDFNDLMNFKTFEPDLTEPKFFGVD